MRDSPEDELGLDSRPRYELRPERSISRTVWLERSESREERELYAELREAGALVVVREDVERETGVLVRTGLVVCEERLLEGEE